MAVFERFAHFIAGLIVTKDPYSDHFKLLRRRQSVTTATELLRAMVPPSTLATKDVVIAATLEPAYDVGGDAYDYRRSRELHGRAWERLCPQRVVRAPTGTRFELRLLVCLR